MIQEEILFRLLQASSAAAAIALLITCMRMHLVKWWLPLPIYILSFMFIVTFLTTFFMRRFVFEVVVATIGMVAISSIATALHSYLRPISANQREASNRLVLWIVLPVSGVLFSVWCFGSAYEGGIDFFRRFEQKLNYAIQNQDEIKDKIDSTDVKLQKVANSQVISDKTSADYRERLDRRLRGIEAQQTDQSLRLHKLTTEKQKRWFDR